MLRLVVYWCAEFALLLCAWMLFTSRLAWSEFSAGIAAAVLGATATEVVRGTEHPRFWPHLRWVVAFWRIPGQILRDCVVLLKNLLSGARETGRFASVPFEAGDESSRSVARRTLAILYTTLPPNSIVIGIDRRRNTMLVHLLDDREACAPERVLEGAR